MAGLERVSEDLEEEDEDDDEEEREEVDLFDNRRRMSLSMEGARRASLGLPDNGSGLTKDFYNIDRPMSVTSLVDLIVLRRTGNENRPRRRSTQLSQDLEERIKKTLAWKEMEDELNKEDVMVNFRKKMRELRKEARQSIPKESKIERKINEERRIQLRTSLLEPNNRRRSTTESVKEAIQEFRMKQPEIIEEDPEISNQFQEEKEASDIIQKTRELLQQMGYLKGKSIQKISEEHMNMSKSKSSVHRTADIDSSSLDSEPGPSRRRKRSSASGSEKSLTGPTKSRQSTLLKPKSRTSYDYTRKKSAPKVGTAQSTSSRPSASSSSSRRSDLRTPVRPHAARRPNQTRKISSGQTRPSLSQRT